MEKYSVLMAVYAGDKAEYVKLAIDSMKNQTVPPDEIVIVVDGPIGADIGAILDKEEKQENSTISFNICRLEKNKGLANALNVGLEICRNDLVARMDADDISLPDRCEKELQQFKKNKSLVVCGCNLDEFETVNECYEWENDCKGKQERKIKIATSRVVPEENKDIRHFMKKRQPVNHPTVMYRKSAVQQVEGYIPLRRKEDFDLFSRMISAGYEFYNVQEHLYLYRIDENNYRRRKSWKNCKSALYVYMRHLRRGGCNLAQYIEICLGEIIFFLLPYPMMKYLSDKILRSKK